MNLYVNTLFEWQLENPANTPQIERILFIESGLVVTIDIFSPTANPQKRSYEEIITALNNDAIRILEKDPYAYLQNIDDSKTSPKHLERRNKNWELISEIVEQEGIKRYLPNGKLISEIASSKEKARKDIYIYRRRYFQLGQTKNALLPLFNKCGAPGKRRLGTTVNETKLGKPSNKSKKEKTKIGVRITSDIEGKFRRGIKRFYDRKNKRKSLRKAYQEIREAYFNIGRSYAVEKIFDRNKE